MLTTFIKTKFYTRKKYINFVTNNLCEEKKVWKRHKTSTCFDTSCVDIHVYDRFTLLIAQHRKMKIFLPPFSSFQYTWFEVKMTGKTKLKIDGRKINSSVSPFLSKVANHYKRWSERKRWFFLSLSHSHSLLKQETALCWCCCYYRNFFH